MPLKGQELIIHSSPNGRGVKGGVSVSRGSYPSKTETLADGSPKPIPTIELSIGKSGQFQRVEVYNQANGTNAKAAPASVPSNSLNAVRAPQSSINGQTVGMAINNAIKIIIETNGYNPDTFSADLIQISDRIIKAAAYLEKGTDKPVADQRQATPPPARETPIEPTHAPKNAPQPPDEDVPF